MRRIYYMIILLATSLTGCDLSKTVDVDLPEYESKLVVECYLYPGAPVGLLLTESVSYLSDPNPNFLQDAIILLSYQGKVDTLHNRLFGLPDYGKIYNYVSETPLPTQTGITYTLTVEAADGRKTRATSTMLDTITIEDLRYSIGDDGQASVRVKWQDDAATTDFYRLIVSKGNDGQRKQQDNFMNDRLENGQTILSTTGYRFDVGDTAFASVIHIERSYYDFLGLASDARNANGSPFSQPVTIKGNLEGALGIFATVPVTQRSVIIE